MIDVIEQVNASNDIATTPEMSGLQDEIMGNDSTSQPHSNEHALITPDSVEDQFKQAILAYDFKGCVHHLHFVIIITTTKFANERLSSMLTCFSGMRKS